MKVVQKYELTERELEVLKYITAGYSNPKIAQKISVKECTIKAHVGHIFGKMEVQNRIQAAVKAIKENLI